MTTRLTAWGVTGIGEIKPDDQLGDIDAPPRTVTHCLHGGVDQNGADRQEEERS